MTILVRPRAWWYNKVPLSVLLGLMLLDRQPFTGKACLVLVTLVGTVCCVANYGYALNDLFDRDEDRQAGRSNIASDVGARTMWTVILLCAAGALIAAQIGGGVEALVLTAVALLLPLTYSRPPLRTKERGWLGVASDAAAAHVYPALLGAVIFVAQFHQGPSRLFVLALFVWSLATGLRGILSHQIQNEQSDRRSGLRTVIHRIGRRPLLRGVVFGLLPLEVMAFGIMIMHADLTLFARTIAGGYVAYESLKFLLQPFPVRVFDRSGEPYLPFVDEGFYKVWGPLVLSFDAALRDVRYLPLIPIYLLLFWPRVIQEWSEIRATAAKLRLLWANPEIEDRQSSL